jgi:hypothetical protein
VALLGDSKPADIGSWVFCAKRIFFLRLGTRKAGGLPRRECVRNCLCAPCLGNLDGRGGCDGESGGHGQCWAVGNDVARSLGCALCAHATLTPTPLRGQSPGKTGKGRCYPRGQRAWQVAVAVGAAIQQQRLGSARNRAPDRGHRECGSQTSPMFGMESRFTHSNQVLNCGRRSCAA